MIICGWQCRKVARWEKIPWSVVYNPSQGEVNTTVRIYLLVGGGLTFEGYVVSKPFWFSVFICTLLTPKSGNFGSKSIGSDNCVPRKSTDSEIVEYLQQCFPLYIPECRKNQCPYRLNVSSVSRLSLRTFVGFKLFWTWRRLAACVCGVCFFNSNGLAIETPVLGSARNSASVCF